MVVYVWVRWFLRYLLAWLFDLIASCFLLLVWWLWFGESIGFLLGCVYDRWVRFDRFVLRCVYFVVIVFCLLLLIVVFC